MKIFYAVFGVIMFISLQGCQYGDKTMNEKGFIVPFTPSTDLEADFQNPPDYARTRVYWWWLESNISRQGILDDLTAMKEAGIMGAMLWDAGSSSYYQGSSSYRDGKLIYSQAATRVPSGPVYMSQEWRKLAEYACYVADSLGIELSYNITSGWNDGGPWVTPDYTSQKLVWSEIIIEGGKKIDMKLPLPEGLLFYQGQTYYKPVAVLALKLSPEAELVKPLPFFNIKAVHNISIPFTSNGLGYDWETFVHPLPGDLEGCHAHLDDVTDISKYVDTEGRIQWIVPAGRYAIMRFVHTGTGMGVSTHSPGAGGLCIDYMNANAMDLQFSNAVMPLLEDLKQTGCRNLLYFHDDSWEMGAANWTPLMEKAFAKSNGYEIRKYLPVIAGKIIENHDVSDRFLYDYRRMIADLIEENHYRRFKELAHEYGFGIHPEAGGPHPAPIDALKNLGNCDVPMNEFWAHSSTHRIEPHRRLYVKQGASAAHIYGKRFFMCEGLTCIGPHWEHDPWWLKRSMDEAYCEGLNRLCIHAFTHSPKESGLPGTELFAGTHVNQKNTWFRQGKAFLDWSARNSFMLSQGRFVADVAYYYGDNVPNQVPLKHIDPRLGEGYDYDVVNTDVILNRMTTRYGKILLPDGMSYHVLVLPDRQAMKAEVLDKIAQLVKAGATVIGPKPETTVGLRNLPNAEKHLRKMAGKLWGKIDGITVLENTYGKGKVVWGKTICEVLINKGIVADFTYRSSDELPKPHNDNPPVAPVDYIHRTIHDINGKDSIQIYYVANRLDRPVFLECRFRIHGLQPELWYPENGKTIPVNVYLPKGGHTCFPLFLDPFASLFVVFRHSAKQDPITAIQIDGREIFPLSQSFKSFAEAPFEYLPYGKMGFFRNGSTIKLTQNGKETEITVQVPDNQEIKGSWQVTFDPDWGPPAGVEFPKLIDWTEHVNPDIKYYSGTANYYKTFELSEDILTNYRIILNLGELYNLAEIRVNGKSAGVWWKQPFTGDITGLAHAGKNTLEIAVVNLWPNRLIGDQFLPEGQRRTKTNVMKFTKESPLLPSGLVGPVWLSFSTK